MPDEVATTTSPVGYSRTNLAIASSMNPQARTIPSAAPPPPATESTTNSPHNTAEWRRRHREGPASAVGTTDGSCSSRLLDRAFHRLGHFVADHPKWLITALVIFTAICSSIIPFTPQEDDLKTGYTPRGARSHREMELYNQFYRHTHDRIDEQKDPISTSVFVTARDGGSLLRETHLNESVALSDEIATRFMLADRSNFREFCTDFCEFNEPVRVFRDGLSVLTHRNSSATELVAGDESPEHLTVTRIELSYPFMNLFGRQIDLSPHFFGVARYASREARLLAHSPTNIASLKLIVLQFRADIPPNVTKQQASRWERSVGEHLHKHYRSRYIRPLVLSLPFAGDEIVRTGMTLFPYLSVGFVIMCVFSASTIRLSAFYFDQWASQKLVMALAACVTPLLATSSALGFLFWFGFRFGTILCVSPFLVMAIGVDDAFTMVHSWQRICVNKARTRRNALPQMQDTLRGRIAEMFVDVGPSITITSLTNSLAFVVGVFTSLTPEIQLFCAGNAMAIFFDYLYQLFLFAPVMVIAGGAEMQNSGRRARNVVRQTLAPNACLREWVTRLMTHYCAWLANGFTALMIFLVLLVYWTFSIQGAVTIQPNITPKKLFLADSLINEMNAIREEYILPNYTAISLFVNRAGNLSDPVRYARVKWLVANFESMPGSLGAQYTHFWLRDYEHFVESVEEEEEEGAVQRFHASAMENFLHWPEYRHWRGFLRFNEQSELDKFFVTLAFHGADFVKWRSRGDYLNAWRELADEYGDLEAFVWVEESQFLDQIETLVPSTVQSSLVTLVCMTVVCIAFMSNLFTVVVATLSILSICIGVFGFLSHWRIDLDPISMGCVIMSIGFSVDFPAHITYHYYRCGRNTAGGRRLNAEQRIHDSLVAIGFPLVQCGLSTILFVLCLLFVDTYMSEVFVKTVVLVVTLGLLHGLLISPALLCALSNMHDLGGDLWAVISRLVAQATGWRTGKKHAMKRRELGSIRIRSLNDSTMGEHKVAGQSPCIHEHLDTPLFEQSRGKEDAGGPSTGTRNGNPRTYY